MPLRKPLASCALLLALWTGAGNAVAQPTPAGEDIAVAVAVGKALLEEGKTLARDGRFKDALGKLEASVHSDPTPAALLELAACLGKLGRTASAWGTLHRAEERGRMLGENALASQAARRAALLAPTLSRAKIVVTATESPLEITLDGRVLAKEAWGVELPLDPGSHTVSATSPDKPSFKSTFELPAGPGTTSVLVPGLTPSPWPEATTASVPDPATPARASDLGVRPAGEPDISPAPSEATPREPFHLPLRSVSSSNTGLPVLRPPYLPHRRDLEWVGVGLFVGGAGTALLSGLTLYVGAKGMSNDVVAGLLVYGGIGLVPGAVGLVLMLVKPKNVVFRNTLPVQVGPVVAHSGGGLSLHGAF